MYCLWCVSAAAWKCAAVVRKANRPGLLGNLIMTGETFCFSVRDVDFKGRICAAPAARPLPSCLEST